MTAMPFLPLLFKVRRHALNPNAENDLGNKTEAWNPPVELDVYGWGPPHMTGTTKEVVTATGTRYVIEVGLLVPPGVIAKDGDRFQLGSTSEIEADPDSFEWYRAVGPTEDYSHNPLGWNPGNVINLVAVKGAKR